MCTVCLSAGVIFIANPLSGFMAKLTQFRTVTSLFDWFCDMLHGFTKNSIRSGTSQFYVARSPSLFDSTIIPLLMDEPLHVPLKICPEQFQQEMRFWNIHLRQNYEPCCDSSRRYSCFSGVRLPDMTPKTTLGKIIAGVACVTGILLMAMPISVLVETFGEIYTSKIWKSPNRRSNSKFGRKNWLQARRKVSIANENRVIASTTYDGKDKNYCNNDYEINDQQNNFIEDALIQ
uniref:Potassium channel tetramerisation-type BTB domain-containing protein n=1 Tax=Romanomermis culicivorax TaxID=13658 RepID=A0A915I8W2_ROMCU